MKKFILILLLIGGIVCKGCTLDRRAHEETSSAQEDLSRLKAINESLKSKHFLNRQELSEVDRLVHSIYSAGESKVALESFRLANLMKEVDSRSKESQRYNNRGTDYVREGQYDLALAEFNKAIELESRESIFYFNRGWIYKEKGKLDLAIFDFSQAFKLEPGFAHACYERGVTYYEKGDYEKSSKDILKAKELGFQIPPWLVEELKMASSLGKLKGSNASPCLISATQDKIRQEFYPNCSDVKLKKVLDIQPPEMKGRRVTGEVEVVIEIKGTQPNETKTKMLPTEKSWIEKWKISACGVNRVHPIEFTRLDLVDVKDSTSKKVMVIIEVKRAK